ncbi:VOC family protein [Amycolatopsis albispora]|nr:VOC family protein [Amycolatopsis albispora]
MTLKAVVFAVARPRAVAGFWSSFVDWPITVDRPGRVELTSAAAGFSLAFEQTATPKTVKNRIHLDLASSSAAAQKSIVDKALALGATRADIGQGELPWEVLADPGGNEFCVLEPRPEYAETGVLAAVVLDSGPVEPAAFEQLAEFWSTTSGWPIVKRHPVQIGLRAPSGVGPWLEVLRDGDAKQVEDRVRLEVTGPAPGLRQDPGGNDFRVVSPG